jgi:hypothetical protein
MLFTQLHGFIPLEDRVLLDEVLKSLGVNPNQAITTETAQKVIEEVESSRSGNQGQSIIRELERYVPVRVKCDG